MKKVAAFFLLNSILFFIGASQTINLNGILCQFVSCSSDQICNNGACISKDTNKTVTSVDLCKNVKCNSSY